MGHQRPTQGNMEEVFEWIIWFLNLVLYYPLSALMCILRVKGNCLTGNSYCTAKCSNTAFNIIGLSGN